MPARTRAPRLLSPFVLAVILLSWFALVPVAGFAAAAAPSTSGKPGPSPLAAKKKGATVTGGPVITATMADTVVPDLDGDDKAIPGDTIRYRVDIANSGADGTNMNINVVPDANTMRVSSSTNVSPIAFDDAYVTVGNTELNVGGTPGLTPAVAATGSLFDNDVEYFGDTFTLVASDASSTGGGTVAVDVDGTFSYLPPVGFNGTDTFTYTIADGAGLSSTATVSIAVGAMVWYVNANASAGGDGRSTTPFDALTPVSGAGGVGDADAPGDILFLHDASSYYQNGAELENGQQLIGQGVDLVVDPGTGPITLATAGNRPVIFPPSGVTGVALAANNVVRGLHVSSTDADGVFGSSPGDLTVDQVGIEATGGRGLFLVNGNLTVNVDSLVVSTGGDAIVLGSNTGSTTLSGVHVSAGANGLAAISSGTLTVLGNFNTLSVPAPVVGSVGAALRIVDTAIGADGLRFRSISAQNIERAIHLEDTGTSGGLVVTGVGIAGSGGVVAGCAKAVLLDSTRSVTISSMQISNSTSHHIDASGVSNGLRLTAVTMSNAPSGVVLQNVLGNSLFSNCSITGTTASSNLSLSNAIATVAAPGAPDLFTLTGCTITNSAGTGALLQGSGSANLRLAVTGGSFTGNASQGLDARSSGGATVDLRVSGSAISGNTAHGITVSASGTSKGIVDIRNLGGLSSNGGTVLLTSDGTANLQATLDNVTVTGSNTGTGLQLEELGSSTLIARIANSRTSGTAGSGILAQALGSGLLSLTLDGNTVAAPTSLAAGAGVAGNAQHDPANVPDGVLLPSIEIRSSDDLAGANTVCLEMTSNNSSGAIGYHLEQESGTTFQLQDFTGSGTSQGDVTTWATVDKNNTGTVGSTFASGFTSSTGCATPDPLPAVLAVPVEVESSTPAPIAGASSRSSRRGDAASLTRAGAAARPLSSFGRGSGASLLSSTPDRTAGDDLIVAIGTLPAGRTLTILFDVTVNNPLTPPVSQVSAQGTVSGDEMDAVLTDDPDAAGAADPTVTQIVIPKDVGVDEFLEPNTGCGHTSADTVRIVIINNSTTAQSGFDVSYSVTGPINGGPHVENIGALSVPAGGTAVYTFAAKANLSTPGSYAFSAQTQLAGDGNAANDGATHNVVVYASPTADAGPDRTVASGTPNTLGGSPTASGGTPPYSYAWTPATGLDDPSASNPVATVSSTVTYTLVVTDANGCTATGQVTVTVVVPASVLDRRVSAKSDDAEERSSGSVNLNDGDLELVDDDGRQTVGLRFTNVTIPDGSTILKAWVQFTADESHGGGITVTIKGQAADNAGTFTSSTRNISNRPRTSESATWSPLGWTAGQAGDRQRTTELKTILQAIISRSGWRSGQSLALIFTGSGKRVAESYEGLASGAALLHVEFAVDPNAAPVVDAGPHQTILSPTTPASASLDGTVTDDGLPTGGTLTTKWEKASGPGTVTFVNENAVDTQASFEKFGTYVLRLTANDGARSAHDSLTVLVKPSGVSATLERRVSSGSDDAEQAPPPSNSVDVGSSDLELTDDDGFQTVGIRFRNITIPGNATITAAWVQFRADESQEGQISLFLHGQASVNALAFTSAKNNISSRPRTLQSVTWSPDRWTSGNAGSAQRTPDLSPLIQAIVSQFGWSSGNPLALIVTGTGHRTAEPYEGGSSVAPLLHIEYTAPAPAPQVLGTDERAAVDLGPSQARVIPNPVRGRVSFELKIGRAGPVRLELFDVQGRRLSTLLDQPRLSAGTHSVKMQERLGAGMYFYRLQAPDRAVSGRVMVLD